MNLKAQNVFFLSRILIEIIPTYFFFYHREQKQNSSLVKITQHFFLSKANIYALKCNARY